MDASANVVGAGPNGLAAAVALARAGVRVVVYEGAARIGGGTRTEPLTLPGFRHDVCSAVHPMGVASPFFRTLPLAAHGLAWVHPPVLMAHPFDDGSAATLVSATAETGDSLGRHDGKAYRRLMDPYLEHATAMTETALRPLTSRPIHPLLLARLGWHGLQSGLGFARRTFRSDRARAFFAGLAGHALTPLDGSPSAGVGIMLALAGHNAGWPFARGGSQSIADALAALLVAEGGKVEVKRRVTSVDELPPADATLLDLTPRQVIEVAGHRLPGGYRRRLARYRYGPGVFKVDWALSEPIPWTAPECRRAGTLHLCGSLDELARAAHDVWHHQRVPERPFVLLAQPTLFDATRAPAGRHTAWAYCHVPRGSSPDTTEVIERQVERFAPGFRDTILARSRMTSRELEAHNPNLVGGDINGGVQDVAQLIFRPVPRLDPYRMPADGLYICSASTPPGGGVHGMCGFNAAASALARLTV